MGAVPKLEVVSASASGVAFMYCYENCCGLQSFSNPAIGSHFERLVKGEVNPKYKNRSAKEAYGRLPAFELTSALQPEP